MDKITKIVALVLIPFLYSCQQSDSDSQPFDDQAESELILELKSQIESAKMEIKLRESEIENMQSQLTQHGTANQRDLHESTQQLTELKIQYDSLNLQLIQQQRQHEIEINQRVNELNKLQMQLTSLDKNGALEDQAKLNKALEEQKKLEISLNEEIASLSNEINFLKKSYHTEKQRANEAVAALHELTEQSTLQINTLKQHSGSSSQGQAQQLLQMQKQSQLAELNAQKMREQLEIAEQRVLDLEKSIDTMHLQIEKQNQEYHLQMTDLQQKLLNARRAEQEAQRWARTAGAGNNQAATNRILNLQMEVDRIKASEKAQKALVSEKQQEVLHLQSELETLKSLLNTQNQSDESLNLS